MNVEPSALARSLDSSVPPKDFEPDLPETVNTGNPDLDALMVRANRWFNSLTQEQRREHRKAQLQSFIRGMMPTGDPAFD